ncbi:hypothetical protein ACO0OE_001616 [Hanseniaspora uvarum]
MARFVKRTSNYEDSYSENYQSMNDFSPKDSFIDLETYNSISEILMCHSIYISTYIQLLNKYINLIKRATALKNERNLMIKFVKKLRFFNNYYYFKELICVPEGIDHSEFEILNRNFVEIAHDIPELQIHKEFITEKTKHLLSEENASSNERVGPVLKRVISQNCKLLEVIEIANFMITSSFKQEILSKTMNSQLILSNKIIESISHIYCIFVKFNQWMVECLDLNKKNGDLDIELLELVLKNDLNENINIQVSEEDDLLLQGVDKCSNLPEFNHLAWEWCDVVRNLLKNFDTEIGTVLNNDALNAKEMSPSDHFNAMMEHLTIQRSNRHVSSSSFSEESEQNKPLNIPKRNMSMKRSISNKRQHSNTHKNSRHESQTRNSSMNSSFY